MHDPLTDLARLPGYDQVRSLVEGLDETLFTRVASLHYHAARMDEYGDEWPGLDLVLEHEDDPSVWLGFRLHRIHRLSVRNIHRINRLSLYDISHRGWEGLNYRLVDDRERVFQLFCHSMFLFAPDQPYA